MGKRRVVGVPRYCGRVKIAIKLVNAPHMPHGEQYRCILSVGGKRVGTQYVGIPHSLTQGIDSPGAYDEVAASAVSFALNDAQLDETDVEFNENLSGYRITRVPRR